MVTVEGECRDLNIDGISFFPVDGNGIAHHAKHEFGELGWDGGRCGLFTCRRSWGIVCHWQLARRQSYARVGNGRGESVDKFLAALLRSVLVFWR